VTDVRDGFEAYARSMTRRLIAVSEKDPIRTMESRRGSAWRTVAMLIATAAIVAAVGLIGTGALRATSSRPPAASPPPQAVTTRTPSPAPTPVASARPAPTVSPSDIVDNLRMFTSTTGWAQRQLDGAILRTTSGVQHWTLRMPRLGSDQVVAAAFVDADAARLVTATIAAVSTGINTATVRAWATDDGGLTWIREGTFTLNGVAADLQAGALDFVGREDGWFSLSNAALGSSTMDVFRTQNAGAGWTHVVATSFMPAPGQSSDIPLGCDKNPAVFSDANTGWITAVCNGGSPFLYTSHDGGVTWTSEPLGIKYSEYGYTTNPPQFVSSSTGFMIGSEDTAATPVITLFVTTNGGRTWSRWRTPDSALDASDFVDGGNGWLLMYSADASDHNSSLWVTHNAGMTWTDLGLNPRLGGVSLDFLTTQIGWAFFSEWLQPPAGPELLKTIDEGRTWSAITPIISAP
jgi:photosystem II stability/assembly factor-like uncharacterized protein